MRKLTEFDPFTGILTEYKPDHDGTLLTTIRTQDVEPILEDNAALQNELPVGKDWRLAASIPNIIIEKWLKEDGINVFKKADWPAVRRKLNDPDYKKFRIWPGKL